MAVRVLSSTQSREPFFLLAPQGLGELQGLPGGEVQLHELARSVVGKDRDVGQVGLLGLIEIGQQTAGGLHRRPVPLRQGVQPRPELALHLGPGHIIAEAALAPVLTQAAQLLPEEAGQPLQVPGPVGQHRLGGVEAAQLVLQMGQGLLSAGEGGGEHLSGGDVAQAQAQGRGVGVDGAEEVVPPLLQHGRGNDGAWSDDPDDVPVHQPLGRGRVLCLLADGHLVPLGDEAGDVAVTGVVGDPAHGGALLRRLVPVPGGEGEVQLLGHQPGVLVEYLIKVAQPEKQDGVRVALLHLQILLHHGGHLCHGVTNSLSLLFIGTAVLCGRLPVLRWGMSPHRPVGEGLAPPAGFRKAFILRVGFRPAGRRTESSRPTDVMVHKGRAGQETRPYGAITVLHNTMATTAMKPRLSLRNQTGLLKTP